MQKNGQGIKYPCPGTLVCGKKPQNREFCCRNCDCTHFGGSISEITSLKLFGTGDENPKWEPLSISFYPHTGVRSESESQESWPEKNVLKQFGRFCFLSPRRKQIRQKSTRNIRSGWLICLVTKLGERIIWTMKKTIPTSTKISRPMKGRKSRQQIFLLSYAEQWMTK